MYAQAARTAAPDMGGIISTSRERSLAYGLCPNRCADYDPIARNELALLVEQNRMLHALPAMETLYQQIINTHNMVLLTDARGVILQANDGTLFLDEIGDMPCSLQAHLLRVRQERMVTPLGSGKSIPVNAEVICRTNHNLRERIAQGLFREDLYYRLNGLIVKLPPLRERTNLEPVVRKILAIESNHGHYDVSPEILSLFHRHRWPGNFRQLTNLLRTAIVMAGDDPEICLRHMPDDFLDDIAASDVAPTHGTLSSLACGLTSAPATDHPPAAADLAGTPASCPVLPPVAGARPDEMEYSAIQKALQTHGGNVSAAARALGVSRNTIYRKMPHLK